MAAKGPAAKRKSSSSDPAGTAKKRARKDDKTKQLPTDDKKKRQKHPQKRIAAPSSSNADDGWSGTSDDDDEDGGVALDETFNGFEEEDENVDMEETLVERTKSNNANSNSQTSRERHEEQKRLARERRLAKPLGNELLRLKKIWERLRRKSHVPKEERDKLVKELFDIVDGRFKELVLKHDAVRVVQTALKYSTPPQRKAIAKELQGQYTFLASNRYSKFLIDKLLSQGDEEIRDLIVPEFYGKVRKLMLNPEASWVLDDIYRKVATPKQRAVILREWYGPEFAVFNDADGDEIPQWDLRLILEQEPEKRRPIMKSLMDLIKPLIEKGWTAFTALHDGMLNYYLNLTPGSEEQRAFFDLVEGDESGDLLKHLAFTESGSLLVSLMLAHGSAKDRKLILRAYKDNIEMVASDPNGHVIILAAYEVVDDTVMLAKSVITPILGATNENKLENTQHAANDLYARTTILYLFEGASKALFPSNMARDLTILDEVLEIRKATSKKEPEIRRKELIEAASKPLLEAVSSMSNDMAVTSFGCQFITGVLLSAIGDKTKALEAVAQLASGNPTDPDHISNSAHGGRMFKTLVQGGRFSKKLGKIELVDPPLEFADKLYTQIKDHVVEWATGPSSFVILSLLEAEDFSESHKFRKTLRKDQAKLKRAATEETAEQKAAREAADVDAEAGKKKKGKKGKERPIGNMGAKLILEKLG